MTHQGLRIVGFQRSVNPSTRRGINKKRTAVPNWIAHPQLSASNPQFVLQLTKDVIMSHQGVRAKNNGSKEERRRKLSASSTRETRGEGVVKAVTKSWGKGNCGHPFQLGCIASLHLRRDSDHHHQCRTQNLRRSPGNLPQPRRRSFQSAARMFSRTRAMGGQRRSRNDQRPRRLWSYGTGNTALWEQEKSSCYQRLAGEKNWICSPVRPHADSNTMVTPILTLGLRWCRGLYRKGGESGRHSFQTGTLRQDRRVSAKRCLISVPPQTCVLGSE